MKVFALIMILFWSNSTFASHSFGGMDMCALYPETMPPGIETSQLPGQHEPGAILMETYCSQCHNLPGPGRHTAEEWPQVLNHMLTLMDVAEKFGGLMGNVKSPDSHEREQLVQYLKRYALQSLDHKASGYGASAFENHCSHCHQLPDPAAYEQWPEIIKRMQSHMVTMKYPSPSTESMMQIQIFLQDYKYSGSISDNRSNQNSQSITKSDAVLTAGSWLALGPFLLLVLLGLLRWWLNQHKQQTES